MDITKINNTQNSYQSSNQSVTHFYKGKSIFITGGTGFIGKVLLEKLLYSCSEVGEIYVLIRGDVNVKDKIKKITNDVLFGRIKDRRPQDLQKIIPIVGDLTAPKLGINPEDEQILIEKVSIVIHSGATVKFNEPLKDALQINVEGTRKVLELCHRMKKIQAVVHVSTTYISPKNEIIEEILYPLSIELSDVYIHLERNNNNELKKIMESQANTYTFSKALTETLIVKYRQDIPTIIIRPSVVASIHRDPLPGWLNQCNGASGLLFAITKGLIRVLIGHKNNVIDLIPVDYVVNLIIIAASRCDRSKPFSIYNCCSSSINPVTIYQVSTGFIKTAMRFGYDGLPFPNLLMTERKWLFNIITFLFEIIPIKFYDTINYIFGRKARLGKLYRRLQSLRAMLVYFSSSTWCIRSENTQALAKSLSTNDKQMFPVDPKDIDWDQYTSDYYKGVKNYLLQNNS